MGIINHDTITLENGIEINDTYYSLHNSGINLRKNQSGTFYFQVDFTIWKDKDFRFNSQSSSTTSEELTPIKYHTIMIDSLTIEEATSNLLNYSYDRLKLELNNYTDDL